MPFKLINGQLVDIGTPGIPSTSGDSVPLPVRTPGIGRILSTGSYTLKKEGETLYLTWGAGCTLNLADVPTAEDDTEWKITTRGLAITLHGDGLLNIQWGGVNDPSDKTLAAGLYQEVRIVKVSNTIVRVYATLIPDEVTGPPPSGQVALPLLALGPVQGGASSPSALTLTGARVGQKVAFAFAQGHTDHTIGAGPFLSGAALAALFETTITVNNQIQQAIGAGDLSGSDYTFFLTM